jgi:hypothetical protein
MFQYGNDLTLGTDALGHHVSLSAEQRATHLYVCGSTGTGKSKFLESLIRQDIDGWRSSKSGLLLIDPHGSLYDSIFDWMARFKSPRPVVPIDLRSNEWVISYNMLRHRPGAEPSVIVSSFVQAMAHVWGATGTNETPLFARWAENILRTLYEAKQTLLEAEYLIDQVTAEVRNHFASKVGNRMVRKDWRDAGEMSSAEFESQIGSTVNRLRRFLGTNMLRSMFGQRGASFDFTQALDEGQIVLVNLASQGARVSQEDASLFATLLISDLWTAAKERGKGDASNPPKPFYVYIDEFQSFVTPTIAQQLDQARGFGLHLTLAHQFPNQLLNAGDQGKAVYDSVMVNARSKVVFQVEGEENLRPLANSLFMGTMDPDEVKREIYVTKVMAHQRETRRSVTRSTSESVTSTDGSGKVFANSDDGDDRRSESASSAAASGSGFAETEQEVDAAVFGQELSSVQFRDIEEQTFRAMKNIFTLPKRTCLVRRAGNLHSETVHVPDVESFGLRASRVRRYADSLYEKLPFALRAEAANSNLSSREAEIVSMVRANEEQHAPRTAKRRIG